MFFIQISFFQLQNLPRVKLLLRITLKKNFGMFHSLLKLLKVKKNNKIIMIYRL